MFNKLVNKYIRLYNESPTEAPPKRETDNPPKRKTGNPPGWDKPIPKRQKQPKAEGAETETPTKPAPTKPSPTRKPAPWERPGKSPNPGPGPARQPKAENEENRFIKAAKDRFLRKH